MNQPRYSISTVEWTTTRPVAVRLAFVSLMAVAGAGQALATIDNEAKAVGTYNSLPVESNTVTVQVNVAPSAPALVVTKTASPDTDVVAGTVVTYTYTVTNTGNQVVSNISLSDAHLGSGPAPDPRFETLTTDSGTANDSSDAIANDGLWTTLAPGDVITLTATYTITQNDVDTKQ